MIAALAVSWVLTSRDVPLLGITCYETVSLDGNRAEQHGTGRLDPNECAQPFIDGTLRAPYQPLGVAPPLTACVTDARALAVFPTDDPAVCGDLGLAEPAPNQPTGPLRAASDALDEIIHYTRSVKCRPIADAQPVVQDILNRHGLGDWSIERRPDQTDQPCTSIGYLPERKTVILIPTEPNPDM